MERTVARYMRDSAAGISRLRAYRSAVTVSHCSQSARREKTSALGALGILRRPHLVLTYVRDDNSVFAYFVANRLYDLMRSQNALFVFWLVIILFPLFDLRYPIVVICLFDLRQHLVKHFFNVAYDA